MLDLLNVILPTFTAILAGYLLARIAKMNMSTMLEISFYVGLPSLTFVSMTSRDIVLRDATDIWAASLMIHFGCLVFAWLMFTMLRQKHSALYIPISMMNTMNIPFAIIYLLYGAEGLYAGTLFYIPNILLLYSLGLYLAAGRHWKESIKEVFKVPTIYAALGGLMFNLLNINVPEIVIKPLNFIVLMTIPMGLLVLGRNLSLVKITSLPTTFLASFLRVGVGLLLGILAVNIFHLTGVVRAVVILDSAMPAAVSSAVLATKYNNEAELVSSVVFVTTLSSLAVIPFLLTLT